MWEDDAWDEQALGDVPPELYRPKISVAAEPNLTPSELEELDVPAESYRCITCV